MTANMIHYTPIAFPFRVDHRTLFEDPFHLHMAGRGSAMP